MQTNGVLSEQDMMQDMLSEEKTLLSNYGTFIPEAACPQLRQVLTQNFYPPGPLHQFHTEGGKSAPRFRMIFFIKNDLTKSNKCFILYTEHLFTI